MINPILKDFCMKRIFLLAAALAPVFGVVGEECSVLNEVECSCCGDNCDHLFGCCVYALPGCPPMMTPFIADPRKVGMSAEWRWGEEAIDKRGSGAVSFGDYIGLARWCNPFGWGGALDIGLEGDVWAVFQQTRETAPLVNADYYIAIPVTYGYCNWAFRFRIFHISSHIGDEYLIENPDFVRKNPSSEYLDFFVQWRPSCDFRLYGGVGVIARSDNSFYYRRFYAEYGLEWYLPWFRWWMPRSQVLGRTFTGAHFRTREDNNFEFDGTVVFGYEWSRTYCDFKKIRVYLEYHNGYCLEGQFNRFKDEYVGIAAYYGY